MFDQGSALSFYLLACLDEEPHVWRPLQGSLSLSSLDLHTPSLSCLQQLLTGDLVGDLLLDLLDLGDLLDGLEDLLLELLLRLEDGLLAALPLGGLAVACVGLLEGCLLLPSG